MKKINRESKISATVLFVWWIIIILQGDDTTVFEGLSAVLLTFVFLEVEFINYLFRKRCYRKLKIKKSDIIKSEIVTYIIDKKMVPGTLVAEKNRLSFYPNLKLFNKYQWQISTKDIKEVELGKKLLLTFKTTTTIITKNNEEYNLNISFAKDWITVLK